MIGTLENNIIIFIFLSIKSLDDKSHRPIKTKDPAIKAIILTAKRTGKFNNKATASNHGYNGLQYALIALY